MKRPAKRLVAFMSKLMALVLAFSLLASALGGCGIDYSQWFFGGSQDRPTQGSQGSQGSQERPESAPATRPDIDARPLKDIGDDLFLRILAGDFTYYQQFIANPEEYDFGEGFVTPEPTWGDMTFQATAEEYEYYRELVQELGVHAYDYALLSESDKRLYTYLSHYLENSLALEPHFYLYDPYAPSAGIHSSIPLSLMTFQFRTREDIYNYLALVADVPRILGQANELVGERTSRGILPNRSGVESAIEEAEAYTERSSKHLLITSFEDSMERGLGPFADLTEGERELLGNVNRRLVEVRVVPAYEETIILLKKLATETTYERTLAHQTGAGEYYAAKLRSYGFDQTPEQAIKTLEDGLLLLIDKIFDGTGTLDFDEWDRIAANNLPKDATEIIEHFNTHVSKHFPDIGQRPFAVESASDDEVVAKYSAFYLLAPVDDLTENRIKYYPQNIPRKFNLGSTLAHESFPGHLYQYNYFGLTGPHPIEMLLGTTAYVEGYAVYSEFYGLLAMGFSEEEARVVSAHEIFMRVLEARLDLGVNYEGWDVAKTESYLSGWGMDSYAKEYFEWVAPLPLFLVPYGLGPLEFTTMLSDAKAAFGDSFDIVQFHKVILDNGALPLAVLRKNVDAWIGR